MRKFRKIWSEDKKKWLLEHKTTDRNEAYRLFLSAFPDAQDVTAYAFFNERSRIGAAPRKLKHPSTKIRPLYSEHVKKGYVRIKVAQPNVWKPKARWVYEETHPWEDFTERSNYIFLDGNNRNFSPDNIERVPLRLMGVFSSLGGCEKGNPDATRLRVAQARLKAAALDAGERLGLTVDFGAGRAFRRERNERAKKYQRERRLIPEVKARMDAASKRRLERIRLSEPERWARMKARARELYRIRKERKQ